MNSYCDVMSIPVT